MNPSVNRLSAARPLMLGAAKLIVLAIAHLPFSVAAPTLSTSTNPSSGTDPPPEPQDPSMWLYLGISAALVLSGGAFAGLTIALMGQDEVYLQVIQTSGERSERKNAASVLNLLKRGKHWVLVTLLLSNVITNETLPIVLDRTLGGGWPAVLGSTALIVIFGEVVPQSICVRYGLPIGAWMAPCVLALMYIMSPVAWPVAKLLDKLLGEDHGTIYKKAGLKTLVTLHKTLGEASEQLNSDEVTIISAVLDLKEKPVGSIMTPMEDVFTMSADTVLDESTMDLILSQGYSRIPIHAPDNPVNFVGMLLVKMLITYDPEDCKYVRDFALATLPETRPETSCLDIVNFFQEGKSHMVLVSEYPSEDRGALGVVTLEDVIEELIGEEIIDESDVFIDVHKAIRRMAPAPRARVPKGKIVEEPPLTTPLGEGQPIDTDGAQSSSAPQTSGLIRRRSSVEAPPPRFQMRRQNPDHATNDYTTWFTQRGATDEIREHLKHLGPSNLASRPRQTRYHAVKIKRGSNSPSRSAQTDVESGQSNSDSQYQGVSTGYQGGIGAGLVSPGADAKDGAHALKLGYGTIGSEVQGMGAKSTNSQPYKDLPQVSIPEAVHEEREEQPRSGSTNKSYSRTDSIKSTDSRTELIYHHRGPTRSGSITEQIVDVNGIRKVVLHTNNTSSSEGEGHSSPHRTHESTSLKDGVTDQHDQHPETAGSNSHSKKRRRRKKRGHNTKAATDGPSEDQPLLQH
ncbi:hypothetical protein N7492_005684 [Penicillium capsulatum]|uniref:CNNM transmembrane domain-containing protein n=1 Tax=Penicillium capsulatum TaxID=69766 RepID=A0A9W9IA96_9EURO|nr:hypothetical protein N7492_005684 [Penicillium capsulatum]KAJ6135219.1 hypothetical protein N7512_000379 [Penicillium capsulatum]